MRRGFGEIYHVRMRFLHVKIQCFDMLCLGQTSSRFPEMPLCAALSFELLQRYGPESCSWQSSESSVNLILPDDDRILDGGENGR